ncbi:thiamine phosphate synthase [Desulfosporosinus sp. BICA1-9]|uniref:thiamine phosphate synthase n=1 Tax=Desulfosporosinus sp. BICA1-9 TaxID=1531958 RepID=UPI00054B600C|nr:thiamine phosphate synthase [Desulfosporosinus sp. BICA1-9]KJS46544.1 MAG: thiamine-phosphate synthase [Peptococcaceae bacterium BRH_c23]KJS78993.1 MAG: thiamine-phosphate synthase [Desulfosporosinus sp. BICA1-9]HBW34322.1 thiamine phosphate synthase [Desulfosporosinus sp.]
MSKVKVDYTLYLVTDRKLLGERDLAQSIELAIQGGVTLVQLREKSLSTKDFLQLAIEVKAITSRYQIPLIINDRLDIALAVDAEGLHVGQEDLPMLKARELFGPNKIIGVSASTLEEAILAQQQGADYLGVGAVFSTSTKTDAPEVSLGQLELIKRTVKIPVVAIGGINLTNLKHVMDTGIDGVSVVSAILAVEDILMASKQLKELIR